MLYALTAMLGSDETHSFFLFEIKEKNEMLMISHQLAVCPFKMGSADTSNAEVFDCRMKVRV